MPKYRALLGIDFDGVGDDPGTRVEPGEILPPISTLQVHALRAAGAIGDPEPDDESAPEAPKKRAKRGDA